MPHPGPLDPRLLALDAATLAPEAPLVAALAAEAALDAPARAAIAGQAADLVRQVRATASPSLMEVFLAEYGLSTDEGVALMCLAEALLRVPDTATIDTLIEDKIAPSDWGRHLGQSASSLVNASTWALMLTGRILEDRPRPGLAATLRGALRRLGEPVIRAAVARALREMGRTFVLGESIGAALSNARKLQGRGYTHSFDMLGEAARSREDAEAYRHAYAGAIAALAAACTGGDVAANPGISVKLSALHPRYEVLQADRCLPDLIPRTADLAAQARAAGMGFNLDAEESDRLGLSLQVVAALLRDDRLSGWDGLGVVVQAYGRRAGLVIDWLTEEAAATGRRLMVRLVKGAYWDSEIKRAQTEGLSDFPVFTAKTATDISYLGLARRLLRRADRIYPQFATHNAHSMAAILHMARAKGLTPRQWEFQRLHGMGETLHDLVLRAEGTRCRIYAPVGTHQDLLAYLVRRLLENGANSSFVNQVVDASVPAEVVAADPLTQVPALGRITTGADLFAPGRRNSAGLDLTNRAETAPLLAAREGWRDPLWQAGPMGAAFGAEAGGPPQALHDPATGALVGHVRAATAEDVARAQRAAQPWSAPVEVRAQTLEAAAEALEAARPELLALLAREAGKTLGDALGEVREAVDFLSFYAAEARKQPPEARPRGQIVCISPWNFPLAIFAGQVAAALVTGNAVLAKPAPQTPLIAARCVAILLAAGVPSSALHLLPGGPEVGAALTTSPLVDGVAFTGSTATARRIAQALAEAAIPGTPLIAETGGINVMIVDSTALPEAAVRDIVTGAFRSAGQRCSALRCLLVQEDIRPRLMTLLQGALAEVRAGEPWEIGTDLGPVIDAAAHARLTAHIARAEAEGRLLFRGKAAPGPLGFAPAVVAIDRLSDLTEEVFGPVLHVASFRADGFEELLDQINASGHGLTFGLHSRIDARVQRVVDRLEVGNIYVNRNQIGAVVESQPFGGEGLSGTGPKAGGPHYLARFTHAPWATLSDGTQDPAPGIEELPARLAALHEGAEAGPRVLTMPGPTGESNRLTLTPRAPILCLGPSPAQAAAQVAAVRQLGGRALGLPLEAGPVERIAEGLVTLAPLGGVLWWGETERGRILAQALARRSGALVLLIGGPPDLAHVLSERHACIDTTASGGNAALLAASG